MSWKPTVTENSFVMHTRADSHVQQMYKTVSIFVRIATVTEGILPVNLYKVVA